MRYYYADSQNQIVGPLPADELKQLRYQGILNDSTNVIAEGDSEWKEYAVLFPVRPAPPPPPQLNTPPSSIEHPPAKNEKASFIIAVIALCFSALAAAWSFIGGFCCGWASWGWAFIGLVLAIVSLCLKKNKLGFWALGLALFAFAWVFISAMIFAAGVAGSAPLHLPRP